MKDPRETRKIASNWREYLKDSAETFRVFGWVWREFITPESRKYLKRSLVGMFMSAVFAMLMPLSIKWLADGLQANDDSVINWSIVSLLVLTLLHQLFSYIHFKNREYAFGEDIIRLDVRATELFFSKSLGQHLREANTLSSANVESGRNRVLEAEYVLMFDGLSLVFTVLISFVYLFAISWVAGVVMVGLFVTFMIYAVWINRRIIETLTPLDAEHRKINRYRVERWQGVERVKTNGMAEYETRNLEILYRKWLIPTRVFHLWFIKVIHIRGFLYALVVVALVAFAAWQIKSGIWSIGMLLPVYIWSDRVASDMWRIGSIEHRMNKSMPSVRSLREALSMPNEVTDREDARELDPDESVSVELRDVGLRYANSLDEKGKEPPSILRNVNFLMRAGERVALIGQTGAGKTTIGRLVQRFMDPTEGSVLVNGIDLRDVRNDSWVRMLAYIPQEPCVFDGTIRYNLLYGVREDERGRWTDDELWRVMRLLQVDFGERLVDGLDTVVGRRGIKLSGGQKQRLMVAAAVIRKAMFIVIDEATSSLDSTTEKAVQRGLRELIAPDVTVLIITHRLSTVRRLCDKFVVMRPIEDVGDGGEQVEAVAGSFEELHPLSSTFRRQAEDQGVEINL
ncbi:MAG: ABC transporter ATP-binding protein [Patescibacteria group bacterium]|nr:ABC transporter ATP-binding protein [Patescibacteria group bacterium]